MDECLLTPHSQAEYTGEDDVPRAKRWFNYRQSGARYVVEHAFGMLKAKFTILAKGHLKGSITSIRDTIHACVILHNVILDLDGGGQSYNIEASRRIGNDWKLSLEARGVSNAPKDSTLSSFEDDARLRMELARYF